MESSNSDFFNYAPTEPNPADYNSRDYTDGNYTSRDGTSCTYSAGDYASGNYNTNDYDLSDDNSRDYGAGNNASGASGSYDKGDCSSSNYNTGGFTSGDYNTSDNTSADYATSNYYTAADHIRYTTRAILTYGTDIRIWPAPARHDLTLAGTVLVLSSTSAPICKAYKLVLFVTSPHFRAYFESNPSATSVEIADPNIDLPAIMHVMQWVQIVVDNPTAKFGIKVPGGNEDIVKVRYAAVKLGLELYVRHFVRIYKDRLRDRMPSSAECELVERMALDDGDDVVCAVGERLAHLRRRQVLDMYEVAALEEFLSKHEVMARAVFAADERVKHARHQR
ncbi:hypothetical protein BDU57DRAFT_545920 [Ampelomyces quisqualis]|uniref:BTB domain-containing protein n=1 Tax=Ampelomyces quisqualis TaxID=50730 RepID=A0A6A5QWK0_AMPQU|nr:hypothetical protein BDU57DRAFT_545920 [Ampelomyces quisqualis]